MKKNLSLAPSRLVALLSLCYMMVFINRMGSAVLAGDIQSSFGASASDIGLLSSLFFHTYAFMQIPGGLLTDHFGPRRVMFSSLLVGGAGMTVFAVAPDMSWAFVGRFFTGLGMASILVPSYRILANCLPPRKFVLNASTVVSVAGLGGLLAGAPLAVGGVVFGWRGCQLALAFLTMILAASVWLKVRDSPQARTAASAPFSLTDALNKLRAVCGNRQSLLLALWFFVNGGVCFSFSGLWAGPYFEQVCGYGKEGTGLLVSLFGLGIILGPLSASFLSGCLSGPRFLACSMLLLAALLGVLILTGKDLPYPATCLWCVAFTAVIAAPFGVVFELVKSAFPSCMSGLASGFVYTFCMMGAACMQWLIGVQLQKNVGASLLHSDFVPVFTGYLLLSLVAALASFFVEDKR